PGAARAAKERRGLPQRAGRRADPRPDHRRRLRPPLPRGRRPGADGGHQHRPAPRLRPTAGRLLRRRERAGPWHPTPPRPGADAGGAATEWVDLAYGGTWGDRVRGVTWANTGEVLSLANRGGNRPSHEGAPDSIDRAIALCRRAGFRRISLRADTDFSQTEH